MSSGPTVVVIGGGVTGTGIARDLAMRGADVTLLERDRLAEGTTGRMHGLLHSGARYAVSDPESARQCIAENRILRDIASHCVEDTGGLFVSLEEDNQDYFDRKREACEAVGIPTREVEPADAKAMEPALSDSISRALAVPDAAIDPFRLVAANALSAEAHGASIRTGTEVVGILVEDGTVAGVTIETDDRDTQEIRADHVVNAAGPWVADALSGIDLEIPVSPSKGAMAVTNSRPVDTVINRCRPKTEGDILVPHETTAILGTTDIPVDDPDQFEEERSEIELLREELAEMVPELADSRLIRTYWGVRPLYDPDSNDLEPTDKRRDFAVLDHESRDGLGGLTTVLGGKLTTYRLMAEQVADLVGERLSLEVSCETATEPLPGSRGEVDFAEIMERYDLRSPIAARTTDRLGDRTESVLDIEGSNRVVCECEGVTAAEIRDAIDAVGPDLGAVRMRTRATMGTCQGGFCSHRLGILLAESHSHETVWTEIQSILDERWKGQQLLMEGDHLAQVRLNQALWHLSLNIRDGVDEGGKLELGKFDSGRSGSLDESSSEGAGE